MTANKIWSIRRKFVAVAVPPYKKMNACSIKYMKNASNGGSVPNDHSTGRHKKNNFNQNITVDGIDAF